MKNSLSTIVSILCIVIVSAINLTIINQVASRVGALGGTARMQATPVNLFGAQNARFGLTGNLSARRTFVVKGMDKVILNAVYQPGENNAYAVVLIECSIDDGQIYFPLASRVVGTTEVDVFADGGTGMGSATSGIPHVFPGDKTSTIGQAVTSTLAEFENTACTHYGISVKDVYSSTSGTIYIQGGGSIES